MDTVLLLFLFLGFFALVMFLVALSALVIEVKKIKKEIVKISYLINQTNMNLIHQTSKLEILDKQLRIIGIKLVPERYKKKAPQNATAGTIRKPGQPAKGDEFGKWSLVDN
jgi:hypothetical protein